MLQIFPLGNNCAGFTFGEFQLTLLRQRNI
jgi:hypothetical protein